MGKFLTWLGTVPWYISAIFLVLILGTIIGLFGQVKSCNYDKEREAYQAERKQWIEVDKPKLQAQIAERDKKIAELEPKIAAAEAASAAGKKVSDETQQKIDQIAKDAAAEAVVTDQPTDCWVRGDRTCAKLAGLKPPIIIDCTAYKRKICSTP